MGLYLFVSAVYGHMAAPAGFEPTPTESKSVVLPIILRGHINLGAYTCVQKPDSNRRFPTGSGQVFKPSKLFWK